MSKLSGIRGDSSYRDGAMLADTASHQHRTIDFNSRPWLLVNDYDPATAGLSNLPAGLVLRGLADLAELQVPLLDEILR